MAPTIYDQINKLQQKIDMIDDSIAYKREIILRGSSNEKLKSQVRADIRGLVIERTGYKNEILKLKLESDKPKSLKL